MRRKHRHFQLLALIGGLVLATSAVGHEEEPRIDRDAALARSEAVIGRVVDGTFFRSDGETFRLADYRGKPLVISLIYTSCNTICPATTQALRGAVDRARAAVGSDAFNVLTIGFDVRNDTPPRLADFARVQGIAREPAWAVAGGEVAEMEAFLDEVGFSYAPTAGGFDHLTRTTILDADGGVYRHVYGDQFPMQVFVEPLKELVLETSLRAFSLDGLLERVKFLCTVYDATTGAYRIDYSLGFGIVIGGISLILMGILLLRVWRNNRRLEQKHAGL